MAEETAGQFLAYCHLDPRHLVAAGEFTSLIDRWAEATGNPGRDAGGDPGARGPE
jgi:hypothetical protein